ncbi:GLUG motif-containing protein [Thalassolituus oleivorans]|uniref:GLUG motif-containing protein n=1 Tax=Thalassolituus oleivorans TaxID=187493 RepID=UPI0023F31B3E|nr:GLUG motif-containing protein [Thalassolituus oleivorans]
MAITPLRLLMPMILGCLIMPSAFAESGRADYDLDDNGLIEINSLADLNEIRNNLDGTSLYGDSTGCPLDGCIGFELTTTLDFDTNADGAMDANDAYWNDGAGWEPIGTDYYTPFTSTFDGNGYQIRNLYIDRSSTDYVGLFGTISGESAQLRNVGLTGELMRVVGRSYVGGLVGYAKSAARIEQSYVTGAVTGDYYVGGLVGYLSSSVISNSFTTGAVTGDYLVGGLVGYFSSSSINSSFATGAVMGNSYVGGLVAGNNGSVNSYWATDTTGISSASASAATLAELQCPVSGNNTSCVVDQTLYAEWDSSIWNFGTSSQLPGLIINGKIYRDGDSDGVLDGDDAFPNSRAASYDSDSDGHPDVWNSFCDRECIAGSGLTLDRFPNNSAAWLDGDLDGFPDSWADSCDVNCQAASGLTLDSYPNDIDEDGINDDEDTDDNNDGVTDSDSDSDGLIDVYSLEQLNAIRYNLAGSGRTLTDGGEADSSGCPMVIIDDVPQHQCFGYELTTTLDFDTNADGVMDANDAYWNDGAGWMPIGNSSMPFTTTFDGNGYQIRNLYIDRSTTIYVGLFGFISGESARLRNLGLTGKLMQVQGYGFVGGFVGYADYEARIERSYVTGAVTGYLYVGGLAGYLLGGVVISDSFVTGAVTADGYVGGLAGYLYKSSTINNSYVTGAVIGSSSVGGLTGYNNGSVITDSYWAVDTTGINSSSVSVPILAELQCPVGANDTSCAAGKTLYAGWDSGLWGFGTNAQLPSLILSGTTYRDSDGDGSLDDDDAFPNNRAASWDGDNDGHPDMWTIGCDASCISNSGLTLDQLPSNPAAWQDEDLDGYPESWVDGCDANCQAASGLTLDSYPNDTDNDGINNSDDTDDNNDGITDADADSDGLIEVSTLEQLNAIRYNLAGTGRTLVDGGDADSSGCPAVLLDGVLQLHCSGYELTNNLDFDTNADGVMDANDAYWKDGAGWEPISSSSTPFTSTFDGNGYQIRNLYIDRSSTDYVGLFGAISGESAQLRNIGLTGELMRVVGRNYVGGLTGYASYSAKIEQSYATGAVTGDDYVGGLVGYLYSSVMNNSYVTGAVTGNYFVGGLAGQLYSSAINTGFATGAVTGNSNVGGLAGSSFSSVITNSHWATDITDQPNSDGESELDNYFGATLAELQCPTSSDNTDDCVVSNTLYAGWDSNIWDFGSNTELPGLIFDGVVFRDSDGDGSLDSDDAFPNNWAATVDADRDGHPDVWNSFCDRECIAGSGLTLDQFPDNSAVWQDEDLDGYPDSWSASCDGSCQNASGLTLDSYPNDSDNDGINNSDDTDDNNDGITDADADSDGLIDVSTLEQLNAIRYNLMGTGRTLIEGEETDSSGCPVTVVNGVHQFQCMGYELINNLDFDTNADGVVDENDAYWNEGEGWMPISISSTPFTSTFDGNGHQIRNLYINRSRTRYVGLFGYISGDSAQLRNVGLTGELMRVVGYGYVGGLVGYANNAARIEQSYVTGAVTGDGHVGGLAGNLSYRSAINNSFVTGAVTADGNVGGLAGYLYGSAINNSFATGAVMGDDYVGGLAGYSNSSSVITNSHWATDTTGQPNSDGESEFDNYFGATLAELQCPTSSDNTDDCVISNTLYATWDDTVWDFGTSSQLPGLIINGIVYRDGDADGVLDPNQAPSVTLTLMQDDLDVENIMAGDGDIVLEANITDPDESDRHTLTWTYEGITKTTESDNRISLDSADLPEGEYTVSVVVTDNHYPPLSAEASITFWVYAPAVVDPAPGNTGSTSSKKSGGALSFFWLMLCGGLLYVRKQKLACGV